MNNVNEQTVYFSQSLVVYKRDVRPGMNDVWVAACETSEGAKEMAEYLNKIKREQLLGGVR